MKGGTFSLIPARAQAIHQLAPRWDYCSGRLLPNAAADMPTGWPRCGAIHADPWELDGTIAAFVDAPEDLGPPAMLVA